MSFRAEERCEAYFVIRFMFPPSLCPAETRSSLFLRHAFFVFKPLAVDGKQLCSERRQKAETFQCRSSTKAAFVAPLSPSWNAAERTSSIETMTFLLCVGPKGRGSTGRVRTMVLVFRLRPRRIKSTVQVTMFLCSDIFQPERALIPKPVHLLRSDEVVNQPACDFGGFSCSRFTARSTDTRSASNLLFFSLF